MKLNVYKPEKLIQGLCLSITKITDTFIEQTLT